MLNKPCVFVNSSALVWKCPANWQQIYYDPSCIFPLHAVDSIFYDPLYLDTKHLVDIIFNNLCIWTLHILLIMFYDPLHLDTQHTPQIAHVMTLSVLTHCPHPMDHEIGYHLQLLQVFFYNFYFLLAHCFLNCCTLAQCMVSIVHSNSWSMHGRGITRFSL